MKKLRIGYTIIGTLIVLIATAGLVMLTSMLFGNVFSLIFPDGIYCATLTSLYVCAFVYFILLETLFLLIPTVRDKENIPQKRKIAKRLPGILIAICVVGILLTAFLSTGVSNAYSDKGVQCVFFAPTKEYTWDDVRFYTVECTEQNGFNMILTMQDGKTFSFLNTVNSATDGFRDAYGDLYGYAVYVDKTLGNLNISRTVRGASLMETYYKEAYPEVWEKILTILTSRGELAP